MFYAIVFKVYFGLFRPNLIGEGLSWVATGGKATAYGTFSMSGEGEGYFSKTSRARRAHARTLYKNFPKPWENCPMAWEKTPKLWEKSPTMWEKSPTI